MSIFTRIIERVFNLEKEVCQSCERLHLLLEQERVEKNNLLSTIVQMTRPPETKETVAHVTPQPIKPRFVPWNIRKQEMEAMDRKKNQIMNEQRSGSISLTELENEMKKVDKELNDVNDAAGQKGDVEQVELREEVKEVGQRG